MNRRVFLGRVVAGAVAGAGLVPAGCREKQYAQVLRPDQHDMVGSHAAGAETYRPLIDEAVGKLLARHGHGVATAGGPAPCPCKRICFVGLENKSAEELCDFKDQIVQIIDTQIVQSGIFQPISRRYVQAGLREARLRPDELFLPRNQRFFLEVMEKQGQPFDYLLFATLTSGTTRENADYQRDYLLTLELIDLNTGEPDKESAILRKGYHHSRLGRLMYR
jgi:hypothetical protein